MSLALLTCALAYGQVKATSTASTSSPTTAVSPAPQACAPGGGDGFITSMVTCPDQLLDAYPVTMARVGSNLYLAYALYYAASPQIAVSPDNGKSINRPTFGKIPQWELLTIAEYQGNLYAGYIYNDRQVRLERATLDSAGNVTGLVPLGSSAQTTDAYPTLSSSKSGLLMAWQSRQDPPRLGFSKFDLPANPNADILAPSAAVYQQFVVKTQPSIAVIESKRMIYVAFEADYWKTQIVAFSEDDGKVRGQYTSQQGFLVPSIAVFGDKLFLAYCWQQNIAVNFTEVMLNPDGTPKGFAPPISPTRASQQYGRADLISTPAGLLMAWRWTPHLHELRIGPVQ